MAAAAFMSAFSIFVIELPVPSASIVLLVNVSVVAFPTRVSVAAGIVMVVVPATAVASIIVEPEVVPATFNFPTAPAEPYVLTPVTVWTASNNAMLAVSDKSVEAAERVEAPAESTFTLPLIISKTAPTVIFPSNELACTFIGISSRTTGVLLVRSLILVSANLLLHYLFCFLIPKRLFGGFML